MKPTLQRKTSVLLRAAYVLVPTAITPLSIPPSPEPTPKPTPFIVCQECIYKPVTEKEIPPHPWTRREEKDIEFCCILPDKENQPPKDICCLLDDSLRPDYCPCETCDPYKDTACPFECPPDECEERPDEFYFRFTGGSCDESDNPQDSKFSCDDRKVIDASKSYYLVFLSAKDDEIYFEG